MAEVLEKLADGYEALEAWDAEALEAATRALADELGVSAAKVIHPCRAAVTGTTIGPSLFHLLELLAQADVVARLRRTAALVRDGTLAARLADEGEDEEPAGE